MTITRIMIAAATVWAPLIAVAETIGRSEARAMRDGIELFYIQTSIYEPVICRHREVDDRRFVFCYAAGGSGEVGGLYYLETGHVWALNGKALQHLEHNSSGELTLIDGQSTVAFARYPFDAPRISISDVLDHF